ncbi:MAG: hypothetical protein MUQ60_01265, partial [Porticoccaceae bacterium]|nr:hypothetical protein [Porticoccaceae bacterium]
MKSPAKKRVTKAKVNAKAKVTAQVSPLQNALIVVDSVKKQIAAHDKKHAAVVKKVTAAKAKVAAKATPAAKKALLTLRAQASEG